MGSAHRVFWLILLLSVLLPLVPLAETPAASSPSVLFHADLDFSAQVEAGMQLNAEGNYEAALTHWRQLSNADPSHPAPHVYAVDTLYWLMIHDDNGTKFDQRVESECMQAIEKGRAAVAHDPDDPEARFLLGQALMHLGRLRGIRGNIYTAGRLGEEARKELERALMLDPTLTDAKYPLGLYYYYASLVPSLFKWLSFLWFIPTGDGDLGLAYLQEVADRDGIHAVTAEFFLANIQTYHGVRINRERALVLIQDLHQHYPSNSLFHFELVELLAMSDRHDEVIREARFLETHPGTGRHHRGRAHMARIWRARAELFQGRPVVAWKILEVFRDSGPDSPDWGPPWVFATRGQILDVRGERRAAVVEYERVAALNLSRDYSRAAVIAAQGLLAPYQLEGQKEFDDKLPGADDQ